MLGVLVNTLSVIIEYVENLKNKFLSNFFFFNDVSDRVLLLKNRIDVHWAPVIFDFKSFHLLGFLVFWAVSPPLYQKAMKTYAPTKGPSLVHRLAAKPNFRHITDTNLSSRIKQCWHYWLLFDLYCTELAVSTTYPRLRLIFYPRT